MALTHLSLGSPIQLDDGSTFEDYKALYNLPSPFPSSFSEANSSPSTQTSSVPSSSFLGYTPPTSDEESDKDADGEVYNYSSVASPAEDFPSIVSPMPFSPANAAFSCNTPQKTPHSSYNASNLKDTGAYKVTEKASLMSQASLDSINSTLVAGTFLDTTQSCLSTPGGLIAPLYPADLNQFELANDASRRDSQSTELSFGSFGSSSDEADIPPTALAPLPNSNSSQNSAPVPSPTAQIQTYTSSLDSHQSYSSYTVNDSLSSDQSHFHTSPQYFACSFADCSWSTDSSGQLSAHNEEHVRNGIFNCPITTCMKHFTTITNLEAHRLLEHAFTCLPLAPHTSFVGAIQSEADQYFPPMPPYDGNTHANGGTAEIFQPYYHVAQSENSSALGLGFVQNSPDHVIQGPGPEQAQNASSVNVSVDSFVPIGKALPRRASDSNIYTNGNRHVSSISWENSLPILQEEDVSCAASEQISLSQAPTPASAPSSTINTPRQAARSQRRVGFSLDLPSALSDIPKLSNAGGTPFPGASGITDHQAGAHPRHTVYDLATKFHAAHAAYQEGVFGPHQNLQVQMMDADIYYRHINDQNAQAYYGGPIPKALEGYDYFGQQYANPHYPAQHVNLASIDPTMPVDLTHGNGGYCSPVYPPSLANHIAHQRVARAALPRRGSESSYLATHASAHMSAHPYALALQAALATNSKEFVLPDSVGPARNKAVRGRSTLPGPKGQEIPKVYRRGSTAVNLVQEGYVPEEVESINLAEMKLHPCDFEGCCRVFKRLEHKRRHQRSHTQEKPYQCPIEGCKRFFSRSDNLTQHKRTHERNGRTSRLTLANLQQCGLSGTAERASSAESAPAMQAI